MSRKLQFAQVLVFVMVVAFLSFIGGFIFFNFYLMPRVVGKGQEITVPDLHNKLPKEVVADVEKLELTLKMIGEVPDTSVAKGRIAMQKPRAGDQVKPGRTIQIWVSEGIQAVGSVHLTGVSYRQAELELGQKNLLIGEHSRSYSKNAQNDMIINTDPPLTEELFPGETLDLLVSLGERPTTYIMPNIVGKQFADVKRNLQQFGLIVPEPRYKYNPQAMVGQVLGQEPEPGNAIQKGATVYLEVNGG